MFSGSTTILKLVGVLSFCTTGAEGRNILALGSIVLDAATDDDGEGCGGTKNACNPGGYNDCFPADGQVELQGGKKVPMSALKVGDHVRVGPSEFSEVYMFTHKDAEVKVRKHGVTVW